MNNFAPLPPVQCRSTPEDDYGHEIRPGDTVMYIDGNDYTVLDTRGVSGCVVRLNFTDVRYPWVGPKKMVVVDMAEDDDRRRETPATPPTLKT